MNRQRGAVLAMTLILTSLVLMLGVAAARASSHAQKTVRYERDRHLAFVAAELALADAERDIAGVGSSSPGRQSLFATAPLGLSEKCGAGADDLGLCRARAETQAPQWQTVDLAGDLSQTVSVGTYTGTRCAMGLAPPPRYLIEFVQAVADGKLYRVTAIGFGERDGVNEVLQSLYYQASEQGGSAGIPPGRISWREIANWPELHRSAAN